MLTDIFARRYEAAQHVGNILRGTAPPSLVQGFQRLNDVCPYYVNGKENK